MGNYADFYIGNLHAGSSKNGINPDLISFFTEEELQVYLSTDTGIDNRAVYWDDDIEDEVHGPFKVVYLTTSAKNVKTVFDIHGYTLQACVGNFETCLRLKTQQCKHFLHRSKQSYHGFTDQLEEEIRVLESISFDNWVAAMRQLQAGLYDLNIARFSEVPDSYPAIVQYIMNKRGNDVYGYPGDDPWVAFRLLLESVDDEDTCLYNLTNLVDTYYDEGDDIFDLEQYRFPLPLELHSKTIVLTEGATDSRILADGLRIMYPRQSKYYTFLDFESSGYGGGVGPLANTVKALAGASIENRVIALFDNDTAAHDAVRSINEEALPENIKVLFLPTIDTLRDYPTIGPTGIVRTDINGLAGSLEMYLGEDVLTRQGGELSQVQWTGYFKILDRYQGIVMDKNLIHEAWTEKVAQGVTHYQMHPEYWQDIGSIYTVMFQAFVAVAEANVIENADIDPFSL